MFLIDCGMDSIFMLECMGIVLVTAPEMRDQLTHRQLRDRQIKNFLIPANSFPDPSEINKGYAQ